MTELVQLIGTASFAGITANFGWFWAGARMGTPVERKIARDQRNVCAECLATLVGVIVLVRFAVVPLDLLDQTDARSLNGIVGCALLGILTGRLYLRGW